MKKRFKTPKIGLSTLFILGKPFSTLEKTLQNLTVKEVEVVDEGLHMLNGGRVKTLKMIGENMGFNYTVHAPFADINIASPNPTMRRVTLRRLEKSIVHAHKLEAKLWVFHPGLKTGLSYFYPNKDWEINMGSVKSLLKISRNFGVEIGLENPPEPHPFLMKSADDFSKFLNELGDELHLVFDVGHSNINKQTSKFIRMFTGKIVHIHASDNDGNMDSHRGVGEGTVRWDAFAKAVREARYEGTIIVESVDKVEESILNLGNLFTS